MTLTLVNGGAAGPAAAVVPEVRAVVSPLADLMGKRGESDPLAVRRAPW